MTGRLHVFFSLSMVVWLTGCSSMIPLNGIDGSGTIERSLTQEQIKQAIEEGAERVGWRTKDVGNDKILALYQIRVHTVSVEITYSDTSYDIRYKSSGQMKVFCSEADKQAARNIKVTGEEACPGFADPLYIHGNYAKWVNTLKQSIENSLDFAS
jgi:hypothetical protein